MSVGDSSSDMRLAVLVDGDNTSYRFIPPLMDELASVGTPTYKRIYQDWTAPNVSDYWRRILLEFAFTPVQSYAYTAGKNATDSAMIIDAMDILYTGLVDCFVLASSDSDFTRLATRIREAGHQVIGFGKKMTPKPFIQACSRFIFVESIAKDADFAYGAAGEEIRLPLQSAPFNWYTGTVSQEYTDTSGGHYRVISIPATTLRFRVDARVNDKSGIYFHLADGMSVRFIVSEKEGSRRQYVTHVTMLRQNAGALIRPEEKTGLTGSAEPEQADYAAAAASEAGAQTAVQADGDDDAGDDEEDIFGMEPDAPEAQDSTDDDSAENEAVVSLSPEEILERIVQHVQSKMNYPGEYVLLSAVGTMVRRIFPFFDSRNYGHANLLSFVQNSGRFDVKIMNINGGQHPAIRVSDAAQEQCV